LKQDEVTLVKNQICKGATDEELQLCLTVARRYKLDPFRGQIWFVKRGDRSADGGYRWIPVVGIDGLQHIAARDHADYGSVDEPEYGPMHKVDWSHYEKKGSIQAPEWARVRAWKKGADKPTVATVYWEEIYPSIGASPLVRQMPRLMLGKCARAQAIRQSYPATDGLYIREEFQGPPQFTDNGRRIVYPETQTEMAQLTENLPHGHDPGSDKAKKAEATLAAVEEEDRRLKESMGSKTVKSIVAEQPAKQTASKPEAEPKLSPKYSIEIDLSIPSDPKIHGHAGEVLPLLEKFIKATWGKDAFWHVRPEDVATIHAAGKQIGFGVTEFPSRGKGAVKGTAGSTGTPVQTNAAPYKNPGKENTKSLTTDGAGAGKASGADPVLVVKCIIERVISGMTGKNNPLRQVTVLLPDKKKPTYGCFDSKLFPHLDKAIGKEAEICIQTRGKYTNLIDIKRIGSTEFEDGFPVMNVNREAGGKTLF
jgi:hypothetical protein